MIQMPVYFSNYPGYGGLATVPVIPLPNQQNQPPVKNGNVPGNLYRLSLKVFIKKK